MVYNIRMEPYEKIHRNRKQIFIDNFMGGVAWGLGATVGLGIVFAILGFVLGKLNFIPFVGAFVSDIVTFVLQNNPQLIK